MNIADATKHTLRAHMRAQRAAIPPPARLMAARHLAESLLDHPLVEDLEAGPVLVPVGHRSEIDTGPLAARLEREGWTVCRPRSDPTRVHLDAVPHPLDLPLAPGFAGIPEPPQDAPVIEPARLRLILVPALAFAPDGHRVGSGMGFFDRFLAPLGGRVGAPVTIGIGYASQLVPAVPYETHDVPLDGLQLEARAVVCR